MQTVFSAAGTMYIFDDNKWKELGEGGSVLLAYNNNDQFDVRLYYDSQDDESLQIRLRPHKLKSKGPSSWIFRYKLQTEHGLWSTYIALQFYNKKDSNNFKKI